jgi:NTP pyrophosphatase (non-canonical NTP hydrolase)
MTLREVQAEVDAWIGGTKTGYFPPLLQLARLVEEVGELARVLAHREGKTPKPGEDPGDLEEEIGDVLFVLASLANREGVSLEAAFERAMQKYRRRDRGRWG